MQRIKDLYQQYSDQAITWYDGLETFYQFGVIFVLIVVALFIGAFFLLSRITK
jgi:hypothetical protein